VNFKRIVEDVIETETLEQKEKRYLGWVVRSTLNQRAGANPDKVAYNMFQRIFGFDPSRYKDNFLDNFQYLFLRPGYDWFSEQQIKEMERIANVEYLSRFMGGNEKLDLYSLFTHITSVYDLPEEKMIKIMNIILTVVGQKMIKKGHKDWEKLLFRKNLDKETEQAWGDVIDNL
jgi:hypothetical protein